jgi:hypothetical protein
MPPMVQGEGQAVESQVMSDPPCCIMTGFIP